MFNKLQFLKIKLDNSKKTSSMPVLIATLLVTALYCLYTYLPFIQPTVYSQRPDKQVVPELRLNTLEPNVSPEVRTMMKTLLEARVTKIVSTEVKSNTIEVVAKHVALVDPFVLRMAVNPIVDTKNQPNQPVTSEVKVFEPLLEGIWVGEDMKIAFISGQALVEGGTIGGWRVKKIAKNYVLLGKSDGRVKIMKLEGF